MRQSLQKPLKTIQTPANAVYYTDGFTVAVERLAEAKNYPISVKPGMSTDEDSFRSIYHLGRKSARDILEKLEELGEPIPESYADVFDETGSKWEQRHQELMWRKW